MIPKLVPICKQAVLLVDEKQRTHTIVLKHYIKYRLTYPRPKYLSDKSSQQRGCSQKQEA